MFSLTRFYLFSTLYCRLPDYDHEISVFDYYVDESGEWDSWVAKVPEATYSGTTDILGEVNCTFDCRLHSTYVKIIQFAHRPAPSA